MDDPEVEQPPLFAQRLQELRDELEDLLSLKSDLQESLYRITRKIERLDQDISDMQEKAESWLLTKYEI